MRNASGMTPLAYSAGQGNVKALQTLIDRGANVHTRNKDGTTPLHQAASSGNQVMFAPHSWTASMSPCEEATNAHATHPHDIPRNSVNACIDPMGNAMSTSSMEGYGRYLLASL